MGCGGLLPRQTMMGMTRQATPPRRARRALGGLARGRRMPGQLVRWTSVLPMKRRTVVWLTRFWRTAIRPRILLSAMRPALLSSASVIASSLSSQVLTMVQPPVAADKGPAERGGRKVSCRSRSPRRPHSSRCALRFPCGFPELLIATLYACTGRGLRSAKVGLTPRPRCRHRCSICAAPAEWVQPARPPRALQIQVLVRHTANPKTNILDPEFCGISSRC